MGQKFGGATERIFSHRPECRGVLHRFRKWLGGIPEKSSSRVPSGIREEIWGAGLLSLFATAHIRWPVDGGACHVSMPEPLARALYNKTEPVGEDVHLGSPGGPLVSGKDFCPSDSRLTPPSEDASSLSEMLPWRITRAYKFRRKMHINYQEMKALGVEVKYLARGSGRRRRHLYFSDSWVVAGAWTKGRSSSLRLNSILRSLLPYMIAGELSIAVLWIKSGSNFANAPSRGLPLSRPRSLDARGAALLGQDPGSKLFPASSLGDSGATTLSMLERWTRRPLKKMMRERGTNISSGGGPEEKEESMS